MHRLETGRAVTNDDLIMPAQKEARPNKYLLIIKRRGQEEESCYLDTVHKIALYFHTSSHHPPMILNLYNVFHFLVPAPQKPLIILVRLANTII